MRMRHSFRSDSSAIDVSHQGSSRVPSSGSRLENNAFPVCNCTDANADADSDVDEDTDEEEEGGFDRASCRIRADLPAAPISSSSRASHSSTASTLYLVDTGASINVIALSYFILPAPPSPSPAGAAVAAVAGAAVTASAAWL